MRVLIIAPHRDDEVIGIGGTLLKHKAAGDYVAVCVVTASEGFELDEYTSRVHNEMMKSHRFCEIDNTICLPFTPVNLEDFPRSQLNSALLEVIKTEKPDEVYIPHWGDMQKDHQIVADAAMVALRSKYNHSVKRIYAYETLSETGINFPNVQNAFIPNVFVDITEFLDKKKEAMALYESQVGAFPDLRSLEAIEALAKYRGSTVNFKAAEAFMLVRETK